MPLSARRLLVAVTTILVVSLAWPPTIAGQGSPGPAALATFQALQTAESAGADITSLVSQYNSLIEQSAPVNSSLASLTQLARSAQQNSLALRSFDQTLTLILVPVIAMVLAFATEGLLQLRRRIERKRMLEMEIKQN